MPRQWRIVLDDLKLVALDAPRRVGRAADRPKMLPDHAEHRPAARHLGASEIGNIARCDAVRFQRLKAGVDLVFERMTGRQRLVHDAVGVGFLPFSGEDLEIGIGRRLKPVADLLLNLALENRRKLVAVPDLENAGVVFLADLLRRCVAKVRDRDRRIVRRLGPPALDRKPDTQSRIAGQ